MPSLFKKSQPPVGNSSNQSSSTVSSVHDHQAQRYQQVEPQSRPYQPSRAQSQRHSSQLSLDRPQDRPQVNAGASVTAEASPPQSEHHRTSYLHHHHASDNNPQQYRDEPKKSKLSRLFGSSSKEASSPAQATPTVDVSTRPVNRRTSVRKSEGLRYSQPTEEQQRLQPQNWAQRSGSSSNLPTSAETEESNLDPFLQHNETSPQVPQGPQVPQKNDQPYQQQQQPPPGFTQHPHQGQYQDPYRPSLARVDTNQDHYPDHYSPEQHSGGSGNSAKQPQPPYISYSQAEAQSPVQGQPQPGYHPFQPPPQQQQHLGKPPAYTPQQQESPQFPPPQAYQEATGIRRVAQTGPSPEPSSANSQQLGVKDSQLLGRPTSAQQYVPPSPAGQHYQPYDTQTGSQGSTTPNESGVQHELNPMAPPPGTHSRRQGELGSQKLPGPPTRESSLQAPAATPGGAGSQGPPTPGVQGFNAGVVPAQSQGQPYRGNGKPDGDQPGRDTPPLSRSFADMSEEEWQTTLKEHEILREKYQKVKRYFFDQQNQVHQLQNTLANQRMSLSRTSLDDSEYAARFNRLHGLIAQLAHSIRKNWKMIPPWMQGSVNKEAISAGAKEMIIVGRSTISGWLQKEVFEKYFHPDLEPGLSTQLKAIQQNIRRFSPPIHSSEEEEALWSKIINWRMATLEGLVDVLRSPQATTNHQNLVELLNENMIASLEMYLNEAAFPELRGNVPMIVDLAVGIAMHLPMESRDVHIEYFEPGRPIEPELMTIETGLVALTNPCIDTDAAEAASMASIASDAPTESESGGREDQKRSKGMFGGLMSTKKSSGPGKIASGIGGGSQVSLNPPGSSSGPKDDQPPRVRLAAGLSVQIRGRSVLVKAPIYST